MGLFTTGGGANRPPDRDTSAAQTARTTGPMETPIAAIGVLSVRVNGYSCEGGQRCA
jgi:hypothetical protein